MAKETLRSEQIAFRATPAEVAEIDRRANARDMSRTEYLVSAALGKLDADPADTEARLSALEQGLERLQQLALGQ